MWNEKTWDLSLTNQILFKTSPRLKEEEWEIKFGPGNIPLLQFIGYQYTLPCNVLVMKEKVLGTFTFLLLRRRFLANALFPPTASWKMLTVSWSGKIQGNLLKYSPDPPQGRSDPPGPPGGHTGLSWNIPNLVPPGTTWHSGTTWHHLVPPGTILYHVGSCFQDSNPSQCLNL